MAPEPLSLDTALAERDAVLDLIAGDWTNEPSNRAVAEAILRVGRADPNGLVTSNAVREQLPPWVNPGSVGAMFLRLSGKRLGLIEKVPGASVSSEDRKSHNVGRLVPVWRLTTKAAHGVGGS